MTLPKTQDPIQHEPFLQMFQPIAFRGFLCNLIDNLSFLLKRWQFATAFNPTLYIIVNAVGDKMSPTGILGKQFMRRGLIEVVLVLPFLGVRAYYKSSYRVVGASIDLPKKLRNY